MATFRQAFPPNSSIQFYLISISRWNGVIGLDFKIYSSFSTTQPLFWVIWSNPIRLHSSVCVAIPPLSIMFYIPFGLIISAMKTILFSAFLFEWYLVANDTDLNVTMSSSIYTALVNIHTILRSCNLSFLISSLENLLTQFFFSLSSLRSSLYQ